MTKLMTKILGLFVLMTVMAGSITFAGGATTRFRARLGAAPSAGDISGQADFKQSGSRRQFSVQVEGLTPGDAYDVMVGGQAVGTLTINALGVGDLNYDDNFEPGVDDPATQFPANFPTIHAGTLVQVGELSGTFQRK